MINNNKLSKIVTGLSTTGRRFTISIVFMSQSYFKVLKDVRLNSIYLFYYQNSKQKRNLAQILNSKIL